MSDPTLPPAAAAPLSYAADGAVAENDPAQRSTAMIAHLAGIFGILGAGIFYAIKNGDAATGAFARDQLKESVNFQIAVVVGIVALIILSIIAGLISSTLALLVGLLYLAFVIGVLVLVITSAVKANKGIAARYPFKIAILK